LAQRTDDLAKPCSGNGELEIVVLPPLRPEEEIDRPAGGDGPRDVDTREGARRRLGPPAVPVGVVWAHLWPRLLRLLTYRRFSIYPAVTKDRKREERDA